MRSRVHSLPNGREQVPTSFLHSVCVVSVSNPPTTYYKLLNNWNRLQGRFDQSQSGDDTTNHPLAGMVASDNPIHVDKASIKMQEFVDEEDNYEKTFGGIM